MAINPSFDAAAIAAKNSKPKKTPEQIAAEKAANEAQINATTQSNVAADLSAGEAFGRSVVGDGLTRLGDNADNQFIRNQLRENLQANNQESNLRKSQAIGGLQGQEQAAQRRLVSSQATSGVRGGAAAAAQLELQQNSASARSSLEERLSLQEIDRSRQALGDFANFTTSTAKFDIDQEDREKNLFLSSSLSYTNLLATERNSIRQQQAAELLASQQKRGGKK